MVAVYGMAAAPPCTKAACCATRECSRYGSIRLLVVKMSDDQGNVLSVSRFCPISWSPNDPIHLIWMRHPFRSCASVP